MQRTNKARIRKWDGHNPPWEQFEGGEVLHPPIRASDLVIVIEGENGEPEFINAGEIANVEYLRESLQVFEITLKDAGGPFKVVLNSEIWN